MDSSSGDVLLLEAVDRLSRLNSADWETLKVEITKRHVKIVAMDLPTSWAMFATNNEDDITHCLCAAINTMLLDLLAATARKDYEDRRRRVSQGVARAKSEGVYKGRRENSARDQALMSMLSTGQSWSSIQAATGCSRSTLARLRKRLRAG